MNDDSETEIRGLIEAWAGAVRAKDIGGVSARHTDDVVMFDVPPPAVLRGIEAYRQTWPAFFEWQRQHDGMFEIATLEIAAGEDVAFATALLRCGPRPELRKDDTPRLRLTVGLRKGVDGRWQIAHEHHSFPRES